MSELDELLVPLSARSVLASALLGTHPPELASRHLVALARRFDINEGTARAALSRMVERGELVNSEGTYRLAGPLLERQGRQDLRRAPARGSARRWSQAVITVSGRSAGERLRHRETLSRGGYAELRDGVWMRPENLPRPLEVPEIRWFNVDIDPAAGRELVAELFDLDGWARPARTLTTAVSEPVGDLARTFHLAAAARRHLTHDPQLPDELAPPTWPADALRRATAAAETRLANDLGSFFAEIGAQ